MHFKSSQELFQKWLFLSQATVRQGVLVLLFKTLFLNILNNWLHTFRANLFLKNVGDVQLQLCTTLGISTNMDMSVRQRENWGMPQYPSNPWNKQTNKQACTCVGQDILETIQKFKRPQSSYVDPFHAGFYVNYYYNWSWPLCVLGSLDSKVVNLDVGL